MHRITDPALRAAAERFENATGKRISEEFPGEVHEGIIELFLVSYGFVPERGELPATAASGDADPPQFG